MCDECNNTNKLRQIAPRFFIKSSKSHSLDFNVWISLIEVMKAILEIAIVVTFWFSSASSAETKNSTATCK